MTKSVPQQIYEDISALFDHGDPPDTLLVSCYSAIESHPQFSDFWLLASKILQAMNRPDDARKDINTALKFEPFREEFNLQLFKVLIQQGQTELVPRRINWLFENGPDELKVAMAEYAAIAVDSGLISKMDLVNDALVAILKIRNSQERS